MSPANNTPAPDNPARNTKVMNRFDVTSRLVAKLKNDDAYAAKWRVGYRVAHHLPAGVLDAIDDASRRIFHALKLRDFITGLAKAGVFGVVISSLACYLGLGVTGGAQGVGRATTRTVVLTIVALITIDLVFNAVFFYLGL